MVGCTPTFLESLFKVCFSSPICGLLVWLHCITLSANRTTGIKHTLKTSGGGFGKLRKTTKNSTGHQLYGQAPDPMRELISNS